MGSHLRAQSDLVDTACSRLYSSFEALADASRAAARAAQRLGERLKEALHIRDL